MSRPLNSGSTVPMIAKIGSITKIGQYVGLKLKNQNMLDTAWLITGVMSSVSTSAKSKAPMV